MGFQSLPHANAIALQQSILMDILGRKSAREDKPSKVPHMSGKDKAALIRVWVELEYMKRELRGVPRLKPADIQATLKRASNRARTALAEPIEVEEVPAQLPDAANPEPA